MIFASMRARKNHLETPWPFNSSRAVILFESSYHSTHRTPVNRVNSGYLKNIVDRESSKCCWFINAWSITCVQFIQEAGNIGRCNERRGDLVRFSFSNETSYYLHILYGNWPICSALFFFFFFHRVWKVNTFQRKLLNLFDARPSRR